MKFAYYDLGHLIGGEIVEVNLSSAANVCLLSLNDFIKYERGESFCYRGGYVVSNQIHITVPYGGHWFITVDLGGGSGRVCFDCKIIREDAFFNTDKNLTWDGYPAKAYPNKKDPDHFTDILYGGNNGNTKKDNHGHVIIENSTGEIVFRRRIDGVVDIFLKHKCPGINETKKIDSIWRHDIASYFYIS